MKIYIFAAFLAFAATSEGDASIFPVRLLEDTQSEAPSQAMFSAGMETPQPTVSDGFGGDEPVSAPSESIGAPSDAGGFDEAPVESPSIGGGEDEIPTPAVFDEQTNLPGSEGTPSEGVFDMETRTPDAGGEWYPESASPVPTEEGNNPNESGPTEDITPPTSPTFDAPTAPSPSPYSRRTPAPSRPPQSHYDPADDDPLQPINTELTDDVAWQWNDSSVEEVEHDRTVIMALSVSFALGIILALLTAHQMLENPHGCCASICRIFVACSCGIVRCICYPCRAVCGCTGNDRDRRSHDIISENSNYTHDLELS